MACSFSHSGLAECLLNRMKGSPEGLSGWITNLGATCWNRVGVVKVLVKGPAETIKT